MLGCLLLTSCSLGGFWAGGWRGDLRFDCISISLRSCFSTFEETSSALCMTFKAQTKPVLFSCAKYTLPNFPFPNGLPISNIPKWNSRGGDTATGIDWTKGPDFREFSSSSESPECFCVVERQCAAETLMTVTEEVRGFVGGGLLNVWLWTASFRRG